MNPRDIHWITAGSAADAIQTFVEGKADAFFAFAPQGQELRAKKVGRMILNTTQDRPWSQYFCCMVSARREFVEKYPVATRRALRAFLKAADLCAQEPEKAARYLVAKGYEPRYDIALEVLRELPYRRWPDADSAEADRSRYGLAVLEGIEEGVEGVTWAAMSSTVEIDAPSDYSTDLEHALYPSRLDS